MALSQLGDIREHSRSTRCESTPRATRSSSHLRERGFDGAAGYDQNRRDGSASMERPEHAAVIDHVGTQFLVRAFVAVDPA
jgi:hypothetical protein